MILPSLCSRLLLIPSVLLVVLFTFGSPHTRTIEKNKVRFVVDSFLAQLVDRQFIEPIEIPIFIEPLGRKNKNKKAPIIDALQPKCGKVATVINWQNKLTSAFSCTRDQRGREILFNKPDNCDRQTNQHQQRKLSISPRLTNGFKIPLGATPSFVQVQYSFPGDKISVCGGVLVHDDLVLTAGHCVFPQAKGFITLGTVSKDNEDEMGKVVRIKNHCLPKEFQQDETTARFDVALLKLSRPIQYTESIQPACLILDEKPDRKSFCLGTGLGLAKPEVRTDKLRALPMRQCNDFVALPFGQDGLQCYKTDGNLQGNTCRGDSGSPMYCYQRCAKSIKMVAVGHLSMGYGTCNGAPIQGALYADYYKQREIIKGMLRECF